MQGEEEYDETFDAKTFEIQLSTQDLELREAARSVRRKLERLARMRAQNENVSFEAAWACIFDIPRMRVDLLCDDDRRAALASAIWDEPTDLADLREQVLPASRPSSPRIAARTMEGSRAS
jgi:hypothetical protein